MNGIQNHQSYLKNAPDVDPHTGIGSVKMSKEKPDTKGAGKSLAWFGFVIGYVVSRIFADYWFSLLILIIAVCMCVVGCVLWALGKNRHWAFGFWGILAPIGFLGVSLLKDKNLKLTDEKRAA